MNMILCYISIGTNTLTISSISYSYQFIFNEWVYIYHSYFCFYPANGENKLRGTSSLKIGAAKIGREPIPIQSKCSLGVKGTVFKDYPPNWTQPYWMIRVATIMIKNKGLLKKFLKTLISELLSFLALISLKTWSKTKVLKNMQ